MAIDDYDSLTASVRRYCARSDSTFNAAMADFVSLAEERLYNGFGDIGEPLYSMPIRAKTVEATGTIAITDGVGTLPDDYLSMRKLYRSGDTFGLKYLPPERTDIQDAIETAGTPLYYTIEGSSLIVVPTWTGTLSALYYKRHPAINSANTTGPMIASHGLAYLEATLIEAFTWMQDAELALAHAVKLRGLISGINKQANDLRFSGPLRIRQRVPMP